MCNGFEIRSLLLASALLLMSITLLAGRNVVTATSSSEETELDIANTDNEDSTPSRDFRWTFIYFAEKKCTKLCKLNGKPYGRMQGGVCRCYCPIIAPEWTLCAGTNPSCDNFCRAQGFGLGGGCIHKADGCYCFCYPREFYNGSIVYEKTPPKPNLFPHQPWPFPLIDPVRPHHHRPRPIEPEEIIIDIEDEEEPTNSKLDNWMGVQNPNTTSSVIAVLATF